LARLHETLDEGGSGPLDERDRRTGVQPALTREVSAGARAVPRQRSERPSTGLMSTTGVPSMASMGPILRRLPAIDRTVTRWRPSGFGRSGERVAKTPARRRRRSPRG